MRIGSTLLAIFLMITSGYLFYLTFGFPEPMEHMKNVPGPEIFPQLLIISLWIFCILLLLQVWLGKENRKIAWTNNRYVVGSAFLMAVYIFTLERIGFLFITPLFLILEIRLLFYKRWLNIIIISAAATLFVYTVFYKILSVPIPMGLLE